MPALARPAELSLIRDRGHAPHLVPASKDRFPGFDANKVQIVAEDPVSTFSIDVDTTSYAFTRRLLEMGERPEPDAIRVEELINYFDYDYGAPDQADAPFASTVTVTHSPWKSGNRLVHIGIKSPRLHTETLPPANLVLLIDTSGSMNTPDKLPLLKRAFALLVNAMRADDTISIVTYAGSAGIALEPTPGSQKAKILAALEALEPGGSTAGSKGIESAYRLAGQDFRKDGINRVLLATDGDFNVGISEPEALERLIEQKRGEGISLSVLGFGRGNYNDRVMQALAQAGNGNASYIDSYSEARKVLVEEMGGTLMTVARDVKVQVDFNPATVSEYRLIGYETRLLDREDFNNDAVDAGDIGAGHSVTAIYEITPKGADGANDPLRYEHPVTAASGNIDEYGFLKIRYKAPDGDVSELIETPILAEAQSAPLDDANEDTRFAVAVAAFGQKLRNSSYLAGMDWADIRNLAVAGRGADESGRRAEFIRLIDIASGLDNL
ncbi:vWA domain-containing protein [Ectorhizobium quercum]|uniref:vWA domain-containing protein n=1 Tax=Ectorhizobium quercum TaxID=2965071 RepID=UPI002796027E|nr:VWA domain-containing protein [Ectorhizobium quercum]